MEKNNIGINKKNVYIRKICVYFIDAKRILYFSQLKSKVK